MKKQQPPVNKLCTSCRRHCKQQAEAVIASCPRYYPGPKPAKRDWKQMDLPLYHDDDGKKKTKRPPR